MKTTKLKEPQWWYYDDYSAGMLVDEYVEFNGEFIAFHYGDAYDPDNCVEEKEGWCVEYKNLNCIPKYKTMEEMKEKEPRFVLIDLASRMATHTLYEIVSAFNNSHNTDFVLEPESSLTALRDSKSESWAVNKLLNMLSKALKK